MTEAPIVCGDLIGFSPTRRRSSFNSVLRLGREFYGRLSQPLDAKPAKSFSPPFSSPRLPAPFSPRCRRGVATPVVLGCLRGRARWLDAVNSSGGGHFRSDTVQFLAFCCVPFISVAAHTFHSRLPPSKRTAHSSVHLECAPNSPLRHSRHTTVCILALLNSLRYV
jgi:hypothetical protein